MRHSPLTLVVPIRQERTQGLRALLEAMDAGTVPGVDWRRLPMVHFAAFAMIDARADSPPYLCLEASLDGDVPAFVDALLATSGAAVDSIFANACGYPACGSSSPALVRAFLLQFDHGANAFYVGCPGRSVSQVRSEKVLHSRIVGIARALRGDPELQLGDPIRAHARLVREVRNTPEIEWATDAPPRPFEVRFRAALVGTAAFVALLLLAVAAMRLCAGQCLCVVLGICALLGIVFTAHRVLVAFDAATGRRLPLAPDGERHAAIERRDGHFDRTQNHMVSVTDIRRPVFLRRAVLKAVLWVVGIAGRFVENRGTLAGIPGIHFGRWVVFDRGRRLLFLSNFDGSWEGYLGDFVHFSARGLNAIWSNTTTARRDYPPTDALLGGGAQYEAKFKAYAAGSEVPTLCWYSAYPGLTIGNIDDHTRVREGVGRPLSAAEAEAWLRRI